MLLTTLDRENLPHYLSYPIGTKCLADHFAQFFTDLAMGVRFNVRGVQPSASAEELRRQGNPYPVMRVGFKADRRMEFTIYGVTGADRRIVRKLLVEEALPRISQWISRHLEGGESDSDELSIFFVAKRCNLMFVDGD